MARHHPSIMESPWADLPDPKRVWVGEPGSREEGLGRLALLTPARVLDAARSQIVTGRRVGLGWGLDKLEHACLRRCHYWGAGRLMMSIL